MPFMTVENVAMFLTLPQVLYQNSDLSNKSVESVNVPGIPFQTTNCKRPVGEDGFRSPPALREELRQVVEELNTTLTASHSKEHGGLIGAELTRARRLKKARRQTLEKQIAAYENDRVKTDMPRTGRSPFVIDLPLHVGVPDYFRTCDEGYTRSCIRKYIQAAWSAYDPSQSEEGSERGFMSDFERHENRVSPSWENHWAEFENAVIQRAIRVGVLSLYPNSVAFEQSKKDQSYRFDFGDWINVPESAAAAALTGYTKGAKWEEGTDTGIRRARPTGHGPSSKYDVNAGGQDRD